MMVLTMASLRYYCLETDFYLLLVKCLALMKASKLDYLIVKCLTLYLAMEIESHGIY